MEAVIEKELSLGFLPIDVHRDNLGWDIESAIPNSGKLRFLEVKGSIEGAETVTVSKNEILAGLNKLEDYFIALVAVSFEGDKVLPVQVRYVRRPFEHPPDFAAVSVNYRVKDLV